MSNENLSFTELFRSHEYLGSFLDEVDANLSGYRLAKIPLAGDIALFIGKITNDFDFRKLCYMHDDIVRWEHHLSEQGIEGLPTITMMRTQMGEIIQRKTDAEQQPKPPRERQQATTHEIPIDPAIFDKLEQAGMITQDPMQWIGDYGTLCAYFLDKYLPSHFADKWAKGQQLFNVRNLAQAKDNYENNKLGKPKNHRIIDKILGITE